MAGSLKRAGWIISGGLLIGTLDAIYAIVFWGMRGTAPIRIFQSIAAGLLGRDAAFRGGIRTEALGLGLHYFIALVIVVVYFAASRFWPALLKRPIVYGAIYGIIVYIF